MEAVKREGWTDVWVWGTDLREGEREGSEG